MPVGPTCKVDFVIDTIESIIHYTQSSRKIIIADDSNCDKGRHLKELYPDIDVVTTPQNYGKNAGLYLTLSLAFVYAIQHYMFEILLKLDTDALIIGETPEEDAYQFFLKDPTIGLIGSYELDTNGDLRDFSWTEHQLLAEKHIRNLIVPQKSKGVLLLRRLFSRAIENGYLPGEHCLGGAYFLSYHCVAQLVRKELLYKTELKFSKLQEDHIFGLLTKSIGLGIGDFATGYLPMGLSWRGLPCSPQDLIKRRKKVIHSTRFWDSMDEDEIRSYFRRLRTVKS